MVKICRVIRRKLNRFKKMSVLLANVNSRSCSLIAVATRPSVCRLSVVCNARAPCSGGCNYRQYFYGIWYPGHPLTPTKNFTDIVPGEPLRRGVKHSRGNQCLVLLRQVPSDVSLDALSLGGRRRKTLHGTADRLVSSVGQPIGRRRE